MTTNLSDSDSPLYTYRVGAALKLAANAFTYRLRKGSRTPYLTHLLAVCSLVMDFGGDEDQIVAAVLHDLLEDIDATRILMACADGLSVSYATPENAPAKAESELRRIFGDKSIDIVKACSDSLTPGTKDDWALRKRAYIARLRYETKAMKLVCAADKIHNMASLVSDYSNPEIGMKVFDRFGDTSLHDQLWYYTGVTAALSDNFDHAIVRTLRDAYRHLSAILKEHGAQVEKSCAWPRPQS